MEFAKAERRRTRRDASPSTVGPQSTAIISYQRRRRAEGNTLMMTMLRFQQTRKTQTGRAGGDTEEEEESGYTKYINYNISQQQQFQTAHLSTYIPYPSRRTPQFDSRRMGKRHVAARFMPTKPEAQTFNDRLRARVTHPNLRMDGMGRDLSLMTMRNNRLDFSSSYIHDGTHVTFEGYALA